MTEQAKFVTPYPITSGVGGFLDSLAARYGYSDGCSIRRVVVQGRVVGVIYEKRSRTFYSEGFTEVDVAGILPGGAPHFILEPGTVAVRVETLGGSPVSGEAFVVGVHSGRYPSVELRVPVSGIYARLVQLKETEQPELLGRCSRAPIVKTTKTEPQRPLRPDRCRYCQSHSIAWDDENDDWECHTCHRHQSRV